MDQTPNDIRSLDERAFAEALSTCDAESLEQSHWEVVARRLMFGSAERDENDNFNQFVGSEGLFWQLIEESVDKVIAGRPDNVYEDRDFRLNYLFSLTRNAFISVCAREIMLLNKYQRACALMEAKIIDKMGGMEYVQYELSQNKRNPAFFIEREASFTIERCAERYTFGDHQWVAPGVGDLNTKRYWPITLSKLADHSIKKSQNTIGGRAPIYAFFYTGLLVLKRMLKEAMKNYNALMKKHGINPNSIAFTKRSDLFMDAADQLFTKVMKQSFGTLQHKHTQSRSYYQNKKEDARQWPPGNAHRAPYLRAADESLKFVRGEMRELKDMKHQTRKGRLEWLVQDPNRPRAAEALGREPKYGGMQKYAVQLRDLGERHRDLQNKVCTSLECTQKSTKDLLKEARRVKSKFDKWKKNERHGHRSRGFNARRRPSGGMDEESSDGSSSDEGSVSSRTRSRSRGGRKRDSSKSSESLSGHDSSSHRARDLGQRVGRRRSTRDMHRKGDGGDRVRDVLDRARARGPGRGRARGRGRKRK